MSSTPAAGTSEWKLAVRQGFPGNPIYLEEDEEYEGNEEYDGEDADEPQYGEGEEGALVWPLPQFMGMWR